MNVVTMQGVLAAAPGDRTGAADATMVVHSDGLNELVRGTTDAAGRFSLQVPPSRFIIVRTEGEGAVPLHFYGETGGEAVFEVPEGTLFLFPEATEQAWRTEFAGCPGADTPGNGFVVGELRLDVGAGGGANPTEPLSFARVTGEDGETVDACYLDADGVYDPEAERSGESGRFAIFDLPEGPYDLEVGRQAFGGTLIQDLPAWVPDGGGVALLPVLVPL